MIGSGTGAHPEGGKLSVDGLGSQQPACGHGFIEVPADVLPAVLGQVGLVVPHLVEPGRNRSMLMCATDAELLYFNYNHVRLEVLEACIKPHTYSLAAITSELRTQKHVSRLTYVVSKHRITCMRPRHPAPQSSSSRTCPRACCPAPGPGPGWRLAG